MDVRKLTWNLSVTDNATGAIRGINSETDKLKGSLIGTQKSFKDMNKDLANVGKGMIKGVTLPLAGVATSSIATVKSFDDSMSGVQAKTRATGKEFEEMRSLAKELGSQTAHSASQAAQGMEILGSAGLGTNEILDTTPGLLTLMSAGSVDADVAAKALTGTMAQFNMKASESNRIVDVFAEGAAISNTNVGELQEAFKMAGGDLANMNMEIEQAGAMAGILANANIVGSQAGTTLSAMSREIKANSDDFRQLGIEVYDSTGAMRDMGSILTDVEAKTGHMTDAQRDAALANIFTGQSMRGVNAFISQGSDEYDNMTKSLYGAKGAGEEMADVMEDNIGGAFRSLKSAGEGFLIEVGDVFKDDLIGLAGATSDLVKGFGKLDDETKGVIVKVAGLAMATGPLLFGLSKVGDFAMNMPGNLGALKGAFGALNMPVIAAVGAIAGLIAVGVHLYRNNEEVREKIDETWAGIKNIVGAGVDFVQGLWSTHGENIMNIVGVAWGHIQDTFSLGVDIIGGVVGIISSIIDGDWAGVWDSAKGIVTSVFEYFAGLPGKMFDIGKNMISSLGSGLKSVGTSAWNNTLGRIPGLSIDGSSAGGENFISKDGAIHKLHRREMVLTGDTADEYRSLGGSKDRLPDTQYRGSRQEVKSVSYSPEINVIVKGNADKQTTKDIGREVNKQLDLYFRKLNLQRG